MVWVFLVLALVAGGCFWLASQIEGQRRKVHDRVSAAEAPDELFTATGGNFIGYRFADQIVIYGTLAWTKSLPMTAISGVEVQRNGVTITKTNRGSQLAGAAIGGLAFGGLGAVVGGLSGSSTSTERLKSIALLFQFDDAEHPTHEVCFGAWPGNGELEHGLMAAKDIKQLERYRAHALNAIRRSSNLSSGGD